jgi:hypothetical protein
MTAHVALIVARHGLSRVDFISLDSFTAAASCILHVRDAAWVRHALESCLGSLAKQVTPKGDSISDHIKSTLDVNVSQCQ